MKLTPAVSLVHLGDTSDGLTSVTHGHSILTDTFRESTADHTVRTREDGTQSPRGPRGRTHLVPDCKITLLHFEGTSRLLG